MSTEDTADESLCLGGATRTTISITTTPRAGGPVTPGTRGDDVHRFTTHSLVGTRNVSSDRWSCGPHVCKEWDKKGSDFAQKPTSFGKRSRALGRRLELMKVSLHAHCRATHACTPCATNPVLPGNRGSFEGTSVGAKEPRLARRNRGSFARFLAQSSRTARFLPRFLRSYRGSFVVPFGNF